ncbi:hypothetical protein EVU94_13975 [Flavobacteriaceae bacterium 144Ye]|nr:hypothetical protein EVU94_13975 [Flavobacteriaceae bacterium 144Ye]
MEEIKKRTTELSRCIELTHTWAASQEDKVIQSSVKNALLTQERSLITIKRSIKKRPAIAVFGQSQVGKSYLIQNLAKPDEEKFLKIYAGDNNPSVNFLTEMNPDGNGKESTGLVSRFTTSKIKSNPFYPFKAELFNQLDIAAILINSYWSDLKDYEDSIGEEEITKAHKKFESFNIEVKVDDLQDYDIFYFIQYVLNNFKDAYLIRELKKIGYFTKLQKNLTSIKCQDRWDVLEILWGNNKFITQIFKMLSEGISKLKFNDHVYLPLEALSPNNETILDVERVRELFNNKENDLNLLLDDESVVSIGRSILSVLTKEVNLQIVNSFNQGCDREFMLQSDLLDFPGSKSREKIPLSVFNNNTTEQKLQLLIRGKVSYLFDIYTNSLGVATLVYCMDNNPPEEKEAPSRLYKWVSRYVGESLEDRSKKLEKALEIVNQQDPSIGQLSPLLIALTKFNVEINKVIPGQETNIETHDSKWKARINENLISFMSRPVDDKWISNWTKSQKNFNFIFPIRDPLYSQATFEGFETKGKELKIRPEREDAMNSIGLSFQASSLVQKHIINPKEVWGELSSPNGSGVKHFSKYLNHCSSPIITETRLNYELDRIGKNLESVVKPHIISGNINEDLIKAKKESSISYTGVIGLANRKDEILSQLLQNLLVTDTEIWKLIYDSIFKYQEETQEIKDEVDVNVRQSFEDLGVYITSDSTKTEILNQLESLYEGLSYDEIRQLILDFINFDIENIDILLFKDKVESKNSLADEVIKYWVNKSIDFTLNNHLIKKLTEKQEEAFRSLINEILKSRDRLKLKQKIEAIIDDIQIGTITNSDIDLVASCCSKILNSFVFSAGWFMTDEESKPLQPQTNNPIFSTHAKEYDVQNLEYTQNQHRKVFFKEWSFGCKSIFEENVKYDYGINGQINTSNNNLLNKVIESLNKDRVLSE